MSISLPESPADAPLLSVDSSDVGDGYFHTLRLPLLAGRAFGPADVPGAPPAAIVNETLARKLWPGRDPIGQRLRRDDATLTVVGLARDAKYRRLWEEPRGFLYVSERQYGSLRRELVVRNGGPPDALAAEIRRAIRSVEPNLPFAPVITMRRYMGFALLPQRVGGAVAAALGVVSGCCSRGSASRPRWPTPSAAGPGRSESGWRSARGRPRSSSARRAAA